MFTKYNLLSSGYQFSEDENLLKFRYVFLNVLILTVSASTFIHYFISISGGIDYGPVFENALGLFFVVSLFAFFLLRRKRSYYPYVVSLILLSSLFLFYFVLLTRPEDEFRLIAFFLALFATSVLLGRKYGLGLSLFIVASILVLREFYDLALSQFAFSTFFSFFTIFSVLLYVFFQKNRKRCHRVSIVKQQARSNCKERNSTKKRPGNNAFAPIPYGQYG